MSWDVSLKIETGNGEFFYSEIGNMTYNVSPMYSKALGGISLFGLNKMFAYKAQPLLNKAVKDMETNSEDYQKLNPSNGWGSYTSALEFLTKLRDECLKHPKTIICVC